MGTINLGNIKDNTYIEPEEIDEMFAGSALETSKVLKTFGLKHLIDKIKSMFSEKPAVIIENETEVKVGETISIDVHEGVNLEDYKYVEIIVGYSDRWIVVSTKSPRYPFTILCPYFDASGEVVLGGLKVNPLATPITIENPSQFNQYSLNVVRLALYKN